MQATKKVASAFHYYFQQPFRCLALSCQEAHSSMGAYKRKKAQKKRSQSVESDRSQDSSSSSGRGSVSENPNSTTKEKSASTASTSTVWTFREKSSLLQFLREYHDGCHQLSHGETPIEKPEKRIGEVIFPALAVSTFRMPYVTLPPSLRSRQRRMIHECCAEIGLYHISMDVSSTDERVIAVSAYADGLKAQLDQSSQTLSPLPMYQYRPWFCRQERENDPTERQQRQNIDHLIDQPGECLREDLDTLDFSQWDHQDLSSYKEPPSIAQDQTWMLVDTPEKMKQCVEELSAARPTEIAFDLEAYNRSKFSQLTCLLQIASNATQDYVIDPLAPGVWDTVHSLAPFFADPSIVKVGHSVGGLDVRSLHRDFGIFVVNCFDTYEAAKVLGLDQQGLARVCAHYRMPEFEHYQNLKDSYQSCDWRLRPLTPPMMQYGRYDVHYLLRLRWLMMRDLTRGELWDRTTAEQRAEDQRVGAAVASSLALFNRYEDDDEYWETGGILGSSFEVLTAKDPEEEEDDQHDVGFEGDESSGVNQKRGYNDDGEGERNPLATVPLLRLQPDLMRVISHSQQRCRDLWSDKKEAYINHPLRIHFAQQARRKQLTWTTSNERLLEKLVNWRDETAQRLECLPGFVAPLEVLLPVALHRPISEITLRRISFHLPEVLEHEPDLRKALLDVVATSIREDGGRVPNHEVILYHSHVEKMERSRKRKRFPWTVAVLAVGAAAAVAVMATRRRLVYNLSSTG